MTIESAIANSTCERTLILAKPDAVLRNLCGEVLRRVERKGYTLVAVELMTPPRELLEEHYIEHKEKFFFDSLVDFMMSAPVLAVVAEGERVVEGFRTIAGTTDPTSAAPGTIRGDYGRDWPGPAKANIVHGSDSVEAAEREIALWFPNL